MKLLAPVKKKKKGEEVYSDDDLEELNDQPEGKPQVAITAE